MSGFGKKEIPEQKPNFQRINEVLEIAFCIKKVGKNRWRALKYKGDLYKEDIKSIRKSLKETEEGRLMFKSLDSRPKNSKLYMDIVENEIEKCKEVYYYYKT